MEDRAITKKEKGSTPGSSDAGDNAEKTEKEREAEKRLAPANEDDGKNGAATTSLSTALSAASKTKTLWAKAMQAAETILKSIATKKQWSWARTEKNEKKLQELRDDAQASVSPFADDFFITDAATLKKRWGGDKSQEFLSELIEIPRKLDDKLSALSKKADQLVAMHEAYMKGDSDHE